MPSRHRRRLAIRKRCRSKAGKPSRWVLAVNVMSFAFGLWSGNQFLTSQVNRMHYAEGEAGTLIDGRSRFLTRRCSSTLRRESPQAISGPPGVGDALYRLRADVRNLAQVAALNASWHRTAWRNRITLWRQPAWQATGNGELRLVEGRQR